MKGQYLLALALAPFLTAVGAMPNAEATLETSPLNKRSAEAAPAGKEKIPPCANIRCAYGAPYYDNKTKQCYCPPQCDSTLCPPDQSEVYYDWNTRECVCRAPAYYLEKREAEPQPEAAAEAAAQTETDEHPCPNVVCPPDKAPCDCTEDLPSQCFAITCLVGSGVIFNPRTGECECSPFEPGPCALILCPPDTFPEPDLGTNTCDCVPNQPSCRKHVCPSTHVSVYDVKDKKCKCRRRPAPYY